MNAREREFVEVLANDVRFLSLSQIACTWWSGGKRQARESVRRLQEFGWLDIRQILARPLMQLEAPLCQWKHGRATPDMVDLSRTLRRRSRTAARITRVISAARKSVAIFGNGKSTVRIKLTQATHDLQVGLIFLRYRQRGFPDGLRWVGEDRLPASWLVRERPDAVLVDGQDQVVLAIEYGGAYSVERLTTFHDAMASLGLAYEIW